MKEPLGQTRRPQPEGRRVARPQGPPTRAPTILIAGVVHFVDRLQGLAGIERARLRGVLTHALRDKPDAIVVGTASPASGALEVISELKRHERTGSIPVLHLVAPDASCGVCGAEICLSSGVAAATLVSTLRLLLRLRQAERFRDAPETAQLLLNLVRNARDAMPAGGRLTIETQNVEVFGGTVPPAPPGRYVMLSVSNEGVGMDQATRERVVDAVERAGGTVVVDSEPGRGSTLRVYLPLSADHAARAPSERG